MPPSAPSYLVALRLQGRRCLVVGGGAVALRKAEGLLAAGAEVTVVAPALRPELSAMPLRLERRAFEPSDLDGCWLVCAATGDREVDRLVHAEAERRRLFVNAADDVDACSFFLPAVLRRGSLGVAVSSDGESPALAATVRDWIGGLLPETLSTLASRLGSARRALRRAGARPTATEWRELAGELVDEAAAGRSEEELARLVARWCETAAAGPSGAAAGPSGAAAGPSGAAAGPSEATTRQGGKERAE